jgi:hypothetical protein
VVQGWAALVMGALAGSVPWYTMMVLHKRSKLLQCVDDTLGVIHTHGVAGLLGGVLTGLFAEPTLCNLFLPVTNSRGALYGGGGAQLWKQIAGALFVVGVVTSVICVLIGLVVPLRMSEEKLAVHGRAYVYSWVCRSIPKFCVKFLNSYGTAIDCCLHCIKPALDIDKHKFLFLWLEEVGLCNHVLGSNPGLCTIFIFIFYIFLILNTHSQSSGPAHGRQSICARQAAINRKRT